MVSGNAESMVISQVCIADSSALNAHNNLLIFFCIFLSKEGAVFTVGVVLQLFVRVLHCIVSNSKLLVKGNP